MKKQNIIFAAIVALLGVLVFLAPYSFAKVCELGEKVMKCHWTARIELFLGITITILGLLKALSSDAKYQLALNVGTALNAAGVILVPAKLIGVCGKTMMHCHSVTRPALIVLGILILFAVAFHTVLLWKKR